MNILCKLTLILTAIAVVSAVGSPKPTFAAGVTFFGNAADFNAAIQNATTLTFEGIVADNQYHSYGTSATIGGVGFTSITGQPGSVGAPSFVVAGKSAPYGISSFDSALFSEGNRNPIVAALPSGSTAVGTFIGSVEDTAGTLPNNLSLTLVGTSGATLDTRLVGLGDMYRGDPHTFVGYIVSGDTIGSIKFQTQTPPARSLGIDNFEFGSGSAASAAPEPSQYATLAFTGFGLTILSLRARKRKTTSP